MGAPDAPQSALDGASPSVVVAARGAAQSRGRVEAAMGGEAEGPDFSPGGKTVGSGENAAAGDKTAALLEREGKAAKGMAAGLQGKLVNPHP